MLPNSTWGGSLLTNPVLGGIGQDSGIAQWLKSATWGAPLPPFSTTIGDAGALPDIGMDLSGSTPTGGTTQPFTGSAPTGTMGQMPSSGGSAFPIGLGSPISQVGGQIANMAGFPDVGAGLGGLGGLFKLASGAQRGNPGEILQGGIGTYNALSKLFPDYVPSMSSWFASAPTLGALTAGGAGLAATEAGIGLGAGAGFAEGGLGALANFADFAGPIGTAIQAITSYIGAMEAKNARQSGWANNPIAGALYSNATAGLEHANNLFDQIAPNGDFTQANTMDLLRGVTAGMNDLLPYYQTAQGPAGAVKASDSITGMFGRQGLGGLDAYQADAERIRSRVSAATQELLNRGVTYEQLGQLPVTGAWTRQTLDAWDPTPDYMQRLSPELLAQGQGLAQQAGDWMDANGVLHPALTPQSMLTAALGSSPYGAGADNLATGMYGGPFWYAMARSTAGAPFQDLVQQHFNPWATIGSVSPAELAQDLDPYVIQPWIMNVASEDARIASTVGGS